MHGGGEGNTLSRTGIHGHLVQICCSSQTDLARATNALPLEVTKAVQFLGGRELRLGEHEDTTLTDIKLSNGWEWERKRQGNRFPQWETN